MTAANITLAEAHTASEDWEIQFICLTGRKRK